LPDLHRIYSSLPRGGMPASGFTRRIRAVGDALLAPAGLLGGFVCRSPGIYARISVLALAAHGLRAGTISARTIFELLVRPLDGIRQFELEFCLRHVNERPFSSYLDLSSPRLVPLLLVAGRTGSRALLCNPDVNDLELTRALAREVGLLSGLEFASTLIEDLAVPGQFDLVTSISVLEHLADEGDAAAFRKLWSFVKPGGRLVVTVPCAAEPFEEYLDINAYGMTVPQDGAFFFGQRFYSRALLERRFFETAGEPSVFEVLGERAAGVFFRHRARRVRGDYYPHWREAIVMARDYRRFRNIDELPGIGVAALLFDKR
jgi:SAM-dependent methyltransferase